MYKLQPPKKGHSSLSQQPSSLAGGSVPPAERGGAHYATLSHLVAIDILVVNV